VGKFGPHPRGLAMRIPAGVRAFAVLLPLAVPGPAAAAGPPDLAQYDELIKPEHRRHWAFQPVRAPAVPAVKNTAWVRNPIDASVLANLEARGWDPAPPAEPHALLRRLYLDLVGLPPTPAELDAFLKDPTPEALDRAADKLLASPQHGEKWGR